MPITLLSHAGAVSTDTNNVTSGAINTTGASLLVLVSGEYPGTGAATVSDSASNSWTALTTYTDSANIRVILWYKLAPTTSASHTFTVTSGANPHYPSVVVGAFAGVASYASQVSGNFGTVASIQPGSLTPSAANALLVTALGLGATALTPTIDSGFTITDTLLHTSNAVGHNLAYLVQTTAAAVNPLWSYAPGDYSAVTMAVFLAAAPNLVSLTPNTGAVGSSTVIAGTNFGASQGTSTVTLNGVAATVTAWGDTSITITVPSTTTGAVQVNVLGMASNTLTFTVSGGAGTINFEFPPWRWARSGTSVTIVGVSTALIPNYTTHQRWFVLNKADAAAVGVMPGGYEHIGEAANGDWIYAPMWRA